MSRSTHPRYTAFSPGRFLPYGSLPLCIVCIVSVFRPKAERRRRKGVNRHNPLYEDVLDAQGIPLPGGAINAPRNRKIKEAVEDAAAVEDATTREEAGEDGMLPPKLGKKLLKLVEEQQKE